MQASGCIAEPGMVLACQRSPAVEIVLRECRAKEASRLGVSSSGK